MAKNVYDFYMQQAPIDGVTQSIKNLEDDFSGLLIKSVSGLNAKGKNKNVYTESFAEANGVNVWLGTPYYESTNVSITCYFVGTNRKTTYDSFCNYINGHKIDFWDSYNGKKVTLVLAEALDQPNEEKYGSNPNIEQTFKFTNINGTFTSV